jgi:hypothetical protein
VVVVCGTVVVLALGAVEVVVVGLTIGNTKPPPPPLPPLPGQPAGTVVEVVVVEVVVVEVDVVVDVVVDDVVVVDVVVVVLVVGLGPAIDSTRSLGPLESGCCDESVAVKLTVASKPAVGVPLMTPVEGSRDNEVGSPTAAQV